MLRISQVHKNENIYFSCHSSYDYHLQSSVNQNDGVRSKMEEEINHNAL